MDIDRKILRLGAGVIICAVLLRLVAGSSLGTAVLALDEVSLSSAILFLQTGRVVRTVQPEAQPPQTDPVEVTLPAAEPVQAVFSPEDASLIEINNTSSLTVEPGTLLQQPLSWQLRSEAPTVLILHTHGTESYTQTESYQESSDYRTQDTGYNVVSIGDRLEALLEAGGVEVLHDRTMYDIPSYSGSYDAARQGISTVLEENPSICLVLDIHRDAAVDASGSQIDHTVGTEQGTAAQLMLVMGTDSGGLTHPNWRENLALAVKLQAQLERTCPGICRPISLRAQRFNQDLSAGALLVEVGATGNTRQQALLSAEYLAQAILALANGSNG